MRRLIAALAVLASLVMVPAAEAHYVINQQVTCALVGNVPTITTSADLTEFGSPDQNIHITVGVDSAIPIDQKMQYAPAGGHWSASTPSTAGDHKVYIYITWTHYGTPNDSSWGPTTVTCPTPVPPPPPPAPPVVTPPVTPPPAVIVCNGKPMPAGTTACAPPKKPCGCRPKPKPPVTCVSHPLRLKVYPAKRQHGEVEFVASGIKVADIRSVRWYVRRTGHPFHRVGTSGKPWERITHHGLTWHIYLWVEEVWGYPQWSSPRHPHYVQARLRIKTVCGVVSRKATMLYPNPDPEIRARYWG